MELIIVSGISGAGKSYALRVLEDLDYFCVDNLPLKLLLALIPELKAQSRVAISIDIRNFEKFNIEEISNHPDISKCTWLFLEASDKVIESRYTESRRLHPLMKMGNVNISEAMNQERYILSSIRQVSDCVIDTSFYSPHDLAKHIKQVLFSEDYKSIIKIHVYSFGFKYGNLFNADFLFDLRSLPNPYWDKAMRHLNGKDQKIIDYLLSSEDVIEYLDDVEKFIEMRVEQISKTNRLSLNIAFGCNGGKHRSVFFAERIASQLSQKYSVNLVHLTISK